MSKVAVEHLFEGDTVSYESYDATKTVLGKLMQQDGGFAGPAPIIVTRPFEESVSIPISNICVIDVSPTKSWIFGADAAAPTTSRRIVRYVYHKDTQIVRWDGFITVIGLANNHTVRGMRVIHETYSTGTVAASGTAVTGSGSAWTTQKIAAGARIGFGSTDPNQISTWYYISAIGSDTGLTIDRTAGTITAGTAYVIEELRILLANTSSSAANGGLFLVKGLNADDFIPTGTTINFATTIDNIKATYWLADAATVTNTISGGMGVADPIDVDTQYVYVLNVNSASIVSVFKYNIRATLGSITAGKTTSAFVYKTGTQLANNVSQINNGRLVTTSHGPGLGVSSFYFLGLVTVYRAIETDITNGSTTFLSDFWSELPPGGNETHESSIAGIGGIEYSNVLDKFVITTYQKVYVTEYKTTGLEADLIFGARTDQTEQTSSDFGIVPTVSPSTTLTGAWTEGGVLYLVKSGALVAQNNLYIIPLAADWNSDLGDQMRLITPELDTTGAHKYYRMYANEKRVIGSENLGASPEPFKVYYRTSGISDNSGSWTAVDDSGDMKSVTPASSIQFMFEFRIVGHLGVPAQVSGITLVYEDEAGDSHFQPSVAHSDLVNKRFAWRFARPYQSGNVEDLRIRLYNASNGTELVDDDTDSPTGTFEISTNDGSSWGSWAATNKTNDTTYIRYTPSSLTDDIPVRAILTQL